MDVSLLSERYLVKRLGESDAAGQILYGIL